MANPEYDPFDFSDPEEEERQRKASEDARRQSTPSSSGDGGGGSTQSYSSWLQDLSARTGAGVEPADLGYLEGKNPEDVAGFQAALEKQYAERGSNLPGGRPRNDQVEGQGRSLSYRSSGGGGNLGPLYEALWARARQGTDVDRNAPAIRQQADVYAANEERAKRNYISDVAERSGPVANIEDARRMAAERVGQRTGTFEAGLIGRELEARRTEIQSALDALGGLLSGEQRLALQSQLANLDAALRREGYGLQREGMSLQQDLALRQLGLQEWDRGTYYDLAQRGVL